MSRANGHLIADELPPPGDHREVIPLSPQQKIYKTRYQLWFSGFLFFCEPGDPLLLLR